MANPSDLFSTDRERRAEREAARRDYPTPKLPYGAVQSLYAPAGLRAIPVHDSPPKGFQTASQMQLEEWASDPRWADAQTALHISDGYAALDDDYPERAAALEAELGARPATLYSTSRGAGATRRKSLYRVPEGSRFASHYRTAEGVAGDVIDHMHRFMFVAPTRNRKTGAVEEWYSPDDTPLGRFPTAQDVAELVSELPEAWVTFLTSTAPLRALSEPYDGPTHFRGGIPSERVQAIADRHPDTSHYPEANSALFDLAWLAVRFPDEEGIESVRQWITQSYVLREDTRKPVAQRQAAMDRAWESSLATQAAKLADDPWGEWEEIPEDDPRAQWWDAYTRSAPAEPEDTRTAYEKAWGGDPSALIAQGKQAAAIIPESWKPRDISKYLDPDYEPPKPEVLKRSDDTGLFYRGVVNEIHGAAGDGKTMVSCAACVEQMRAGERVLYLNYEEADGRIIARLLMLGATPEDIEERFDLVRPEEAPTSGALEELKARGYGLVIVDTVGESIPNVGTGDSNSTDDVTVWHKFARSFADAGACVLTVDHITKAAADEGGSRALMPIGSQAKFAGYKGAVYLLEPHPSGGLSRGEKGALRFTLAKDNGSGLGLAKGELAATLWLDSTDPESVTWTIAAPLTREERTEAKEEQQSSEETTRTFQIIEALKRAGEPITKGALRRALGYTGNAMAKHQKAFDGLVSRKAVVLSEGSRGSTLIGLPAPSAPAALLGMPEGADSALPTIRTNRDSPSAGRSAEGADSQDRPSARPSAKGSESELETRIVDPAMPDPREGITDAEPDAPFEEDESPALSDHEWHESLARLNEQAEHIFGHE